MDPKRMIRKARSVALAGEDQCFQCLLEHHAVLNRVIDGHIETEEERRIARVAAGMVHLMLLRRGLGQLRMSASQGGMTR